MTRLRSTPARCELTTNSFAKHPYRVIFLGTAAGMALMSFSILLGMPIVVSMFFLFAGILLVYGFGVGKTTYKLYQDGIEQSMKQFIPNYMGRSPKVRFISWADLKSYQVGTDRKRSLEEYSFLKMYLRRSPGQIWITDEVDRAGFDLFLREFKSLMSEGETTHVHDELVQSQASPVKHIKQRKQFYYTFWGKLTAILLLVGTAALLFYGVAYGMRVTNWFRLLIILIPGVLYVTYRVFWTKPKDGY